MTGEKLNTIKLSRAQLEELTWEQAAALLSDYTPMVDTENGIVVTIVETIDNPPCLVQDNPERTVLIPGDKLKECKFYWGYRDEACIEIHTDSDVYYLSRFDICEMGRDDAYSKYLNPATRYFASEITTYLNNLGDIVDNDSHVQLTEGSLMPGDFVIHLNMDGGVWLYVYEQYLNEWSSCYRVEYIKDEDMPESMLVDCKYNEEGGEE